MKAHWKVRFVNESGELTEAGFDGTLAEAAAAHADKDVRAVVHHGAITEDSGTQDAARGSDSISVKKR